MDNISFAEIDIEPPPGYARPKDEVLRSKVMHPAWAEALSPQPIAPRAPDPVREKFYEMRRLASKAPFPKTTSELFYRQARFMEGFTDNYEGDAKFNMYYPCYQQMGYDYLRTYFTWRTHLRSGDMRETSLSYIFLYIYELLSGIGVSGPEEGLDRLMDVWRAYLGANPALAAYLPKWLKDYHVFYELPVSFTDFVDKHDLRNYYSLTLLTDIGGSGQLALWSNLSGYDITKSRFWKEGFDALISKCFDAVLSKIHDFCLSKGAQFEDLLVYSTERRQPWQPFKGALFAGRYKRRDCEVHFSKYERYYCKGGQWTANLPIYYSSQKDFIGYIIKKTEACLRAAVGYKYKLVAEIKPGSKPFRELQRTAANRAQLDKVIEKAVTEFYAESTRTVVTVDRRRLERIREEAQETQEQLIVHEDDPTEMTEAVSILFGETVGDGVDCSGGGLDESTVATEAVNGTEAVNPAGAMTLGFSDGWKALGKALTDTQHEALRIIFESEDIKSYADEQGIMLEVLIDGINERASELIGDSIMELADDVYIFDEYRGYVESLLNRD